MSFAKNIGFVDQIVRALIIFDVLIAYLLNFIAGFSAFALFSFALVLAGSCLMGYCPLYGFLGLTTRQHYESRRR